MKEEAEDMLKYANGDVALAGWLAEVDRLVMKMWGMGLFDLPDMCTRDWYDAGNTPQNFVEETVADCVADEFGDME